MWTVILWAAVVVLLLVIVSGILRKFVGVIRIREGMAVAFEYLGSCRTIVMTFDGHRFRRGCSVRNAFIEAGLGSNRAGKCWCIWQVCGIVFYLCGLVEPAKYSDHNEADGFGEGIYIFLHDLQENFLLLKAETKKTSDSGATVAPDVEGFFRMKVGNPYLFPFRTPKGVVRDVITTMERIMDRHVRTLTSNELQERKDVWEHICNDSDIVMMRTTWGVDILPRSVGVGAIDYGVAFQEALEAKAIAGLEAEAKVAKIAAIDQALTAWVSNQAVAMRKTVAEALAILKGDGSWARQRDMYMAQILAGEGATLFLAGNPDGTPFAAGSLGQTAAVFAAAFGNRAAGQGNQDNRNKRNSRQKGSGDKGGSTGEPQGGSSPADSYAESAEKIFQKTGKYPDWDPLKRTPS